MKERIEAGEAFDGRVTVTGEIDQLLTYLNKLDTNYEHWYYRLATAEEPEGYEVEQKTVASDEASLTARRFWRPMGCCVRRTAKRRVK